MHNIPRILSSAPDEPVSADFMPPRPDRPRPSERGFAGGRVEFALEAEVTAVLRALARRRGATVFVGVLTAWAALLSRLSRLSGRTDIVVGSPVANRRGRDAGQLIGFLVNSLALRVDLSGPPADPGRAPGRLAYVIFTSGSSGRPEGVAVKHRSVLNLFADWQARTGAEPGDVVAVREA